ncbi:hypothetical protein [Flavobacterium capsici]|uniref:Uncharacterized protein n=1 Tax=Flavobacterium capsici TaxID=3075618 RepID=A0AA96EXG9_9FLAO|nr:MULTISPECIES: hypothetical protein [unclassified Flavobacterium]WNM19971.1 hypothetical protein RN608_04640 [Flavobacterium sp. PMR2A8]WNM21360.1 hypothetical protein RN605_11810 [Flavobacterium sp. PMTSA4]
MNYLKFTQYAYLIAGVIFAYDAFTKWQSEDANYVISLVFAVIGIFMFFFRRRFAKKFDDRNKKP